MQQIRLHINEHSPTAQKKEISSNNNNNTTFCLRQSRRFVEQSQAFHPRFPNQSSPNPRTVKMPTKEEKAARNARFGGRPVAILAERALICRHCYSKSSDAFQPELGLPLNVECIFENSDGSACKDCGKGRDTCDPVSCFTPDSVVIY